MDELYEEMKKKLNELYASQSGFVTMDMKLFFRLYKAVCYLTHIERMAKDL